VRSANESQLGDTSCSMCIGDLPSFASTDELVQIMVMTDFDPICCNVIALCLLTRPCFCYLLVARALIVTFVLVGDNSLLECEVDYGIQ
jgi:hypothetical protein